MFCRVDDYVVIASGPAHHLVKVVSISGDLLEGVLEKKRPAIDEKISFSKKDIIASLGDDPPGGSVFGCNIEPFWRRASLAPWGEVLFFRRITKEDSRALRTSMKEAGAWIEDQGIDGLLPIQTQVRPQKGRTVGAWKTGDPEKEKPHLLTLRPMPGEMDVYDAMIREYGRGVWAVLLPDRIKANWISVYHDYVMVNRVTEEQLQNMLTGLEESASFSEFRGRLSEQELPVFKAVLKYINDVHKLNAAHLSVLVTQGNDISGIWPDSPIDLMEMGETITDAARKSPEELWCESLVIVANGQKLPKDISKLMVASITLCKS